MTKTPDMKTTDEIIAMLENLVNIESGLYEDETDDDYSELLLNSLTSYQIALNKAKEIRSKHE